MLNIVIPMAGAGRRFSVAGYKDPKPLIMVHGVPMIKIVIDNLRPNTAHRFIFICQKEHVRSYNLSTKLHNWAPNCIIIEIDCITDGAARTVLAAESLINNNIPLMIANSDQYIDTDIDSYLNHMNENNLDGLVMTMSANDPKWSYAEIGPNKLVKRLVEKEVISEEATVGIYNFKMGSQFISSAKAMIKNDIRVNGEFYVAPVYNHLILDGQKIGVFNIGSEGKGMYGLGIPSDLHYFIENPISYKAIESCR